MKGKSARDPIPPRILSCVVCGARSECLKASHLWGVRRDRRRLRQVVNEIRYNARLLPTAELEAGREAHETLEGMRHVEKNLHIIVDSINRRAPPFYLTATFCSPTFGGIRCQPDAVYVEATGSTLRLFIIEDKTSNQPRYYTQLYAEAVILTDRQCLVAPAFEADQLSLGGKEDQERYPFFTQLRGFDTFLVDAALNPYGSLDKLRDKPLAPMRISTNFHMQPGMEKKYFVVTQSKKKILSALKHPQRLGAGISPQMKFTRKGRELELYLPKKAQPD